MAIIQTIFGQLQSAFSKVKDWTAGMASRVLSGIGSRLVEAGRSFLDVAETVQKAGLPLDRHEIATVIKLGYRERELEGFLQTLDKSKLLSPEYMIEKDLLSGAKYMLVGKVTVYDTKNKESYRKWVSTYLDEPDTLETMESMFLNALNEGNSQADAEYFNFQAEFLYHNEGLPY